MSKPIDLSLIATAVEQSGYGQAVEEFRFAKPRRWRFDLCWPKLMVAFEREGGTWGDSRHTSGAGYAGDCEKYNTAQIHGWIVIRATVDMILSGKALDQLMKALKIRSKGVK